MRKYLVLAVALALFGACDSTEPRVPAGVQVDPQSLTLVVGDTVPIQAVVVDEAGRPFDTPPEGFGITWTSTNPGVAPVTDGEVAARASGQTTVRATAGTLPPAEVGVQVTARALNASLSVTFTGHQSGNLTIDESFDFDSLDWDSNFAFTYFETEFEDQDIIAQQARPGGLVDFVWFWIADEVLDTGTQEVYGGVFLYGYDPDAETAEALYEILSGSATFTTATGARLAGTFELAAEEEDLGAPLTFANGSFDLPLVTEDEAFGPATAAASMDGGMIQLPRVLRELRQERRR